MLDILSNLLVMDNNQHIFDCVIDSNKRYSSPLNGLSGIKINPIINIDDRSWYYRDSSPLNGLNRIQGSYAINIDDRSRVPML